MSRRSEDTLPVHGGNFKVSFSLYSILYDILCYTYFLFYSVFIYILAASAFLVFSARCYATRLFSLNLHQSSLAHL